MKASVFTFFDLFEITLITSWNKPLLRLADWRHPTECLQITLYLLGLVASMVPPNFKHTYFLLSPSVACLAVAIVCKSVLLANFLHFTLSVAQIVSFVCEVMISVVFCETEFTLTVPAKVNLDTNNWRRNFRHDHGDFTRAIRAVQCKTTEPLAKWTDPQFITILNRTELSFT